MTEEKENEQVFDYTQKRICQSCGMPIRKESDHGTNSDGSLNGDYCHYCFKDGSFTEDGITMEEKIEKNVAIAVKKGMDEEKAKKLANKILPKLRRWSDTTESQKT
jgi:hypothetical protein